tara:strand:+ start:1852 stop:2202 length:351 start_codon:yes stop_codon:yes gene_type:complete
VILKEPIFVENSKIPALLSWVIEIWAITLFPFVFCRGELSEGTKRHETIHHRQYVELLVVGFLLLYLVDFLHGLIKYRISEKAYMRIRFEQEAYDKDEDLKYLDNRPLYAWRNYKV